MWTLCVVRFIRRKCVLGIIFTLSLIYCIVSFVQEVPTEEYAEVNPFPVRKLTKFQWRSESDDNATADSQMTCRNSVQGKVLIADDRGYVCNRGDLLFTGCCNVNSESTKHYWCETCKDNNCCSIYEYCISCCLHPDKKELLQKVIGKAEQTFHVLLSSISDHFELCLAKCRTSSSSVQHENSYRDPKAKHCYGEMPPMTSAP
ncbi:unnamed protein product [Bemisia tabaci]|uniref:SREBP regulating gene protein n=1 Tax=Bemisia tabaci TaxID=7038 RepID=A0A9P0A3V1_BEMTA|nr:unnamed protein product [Bemisia tabaci]